MISCMSYDPFHAFYNSFIEIRGEGEKKREKGGGEEKKNKG